MSRLLSIELENFMSLPHAKFDFDTSGIISPVGYNDSGKSALRRALEILWFDKYSQTQAKMITDGRDSFTITNTFDDGVLIQRTKYSSGAGRWLMTRNSQVVFDNKLPNGSLAATKGVPDAIAQYLGVVRDEPTGEILNIRRNTNKLLPITTTGGENYQIFNNLCRGERIAYAVKTLNSDVNAKNRELAANSSRLIGKQEALASMQVFDEQTEAELLKTANDLKSKTAKLASLLAIAQRYNIFADKAVIAPIQMTDTSRLEVLYAIKQAYINSQKETIQPISIIDTSRYAKLLSMQQLLSAMQGTVISQIPVIDLSRYSKLRELSGIATKLSAQEQELASLQNTYKTFRDELTQTARLNNWRICKHCGNIVTADDANCC